MEFKIKIIYFIIFFLNLIIGHPLGFAEVPSFKKKLSELPKQINEKAITDCFPKLKDVLTEQDVQDLNSLRTSIERVYLLRPALLYMRQLEIKKEDGKKIVWEFNALPNNKPNFEVYSVKLFEYNDKNHLDERPVPKGMDNMPRLQLNKFMGDGEIIRDERWEQYIISPVQNLNLKSRQFKVQELESKDQKTNKKFNCRLLENKLPLCQCI